MTTPRVLPSPNKKATVADAGPLRSLQLIESFDSTRPSEIIPITLSHGSAVSATDRMSAKIRWAERARYTVLTREVPTRFAPFNAIIRVSEAGTEDQKRDYLAELVFETTEPTD